MTTRRVAAISFLVTVCLSASGWVGEWHNTLTPLSIPSTNRPKGLPTFTHRSGTNPAFRLYERKLKVPGATVQLDGRRGLPEFPHRGTPVPAFHAYEGKRIPRRSSPTRTTLPKPTPLATPKKGTITR